MVQISCVLVSQSKSAHPFQILQQGQDHLFSHAASPPLLEQSEPIIHCTVLFECCKDISHCLVPQRGFEAHYFVLLVFPSVHDPPQLLFERELNSAGESFAVRVESLFDRAKTVKVEYVESSVLLSGHHSEA